MDGFSNFQIIRSKSNNMHNNTCNNVDKCIDNYEDNLEDLLQYGKYTNGNSRRRADNPHKTEHPGSNSKDIHHSRSSHFSDHLTGGSNRISPDTENNKGRAPSSVPEKDMHHEKEHFFKLVIADRRVGANHYKSLINDNIYQLSDWCRGGSSYTPAEDIIVQRNHSKACNLNKITADTFSSSLDGDRDIKKIGGERDNKKEAANWKPP